jgi:preprotein translocase subunit SecA
MLLYLVHFFNHNTMFKFFKSVFDPSKKALKTLESVIVQIDGFEQRNESMSLSEMKERVSLIRKELRDLSDQIPSEFKSPLRAKGKDANYVKKEEALKTKLLENLPEVYSLVREILKRESGKRHYKVQMQAAALLAQGYKLTELKTGEGKTLVFQLPAALYGLTGRGSHVVTVNDYLARRDGEYAGHILSKLGLTVGIITPQESYRFVSDDEVSVFKGEEAAEKIKNHKISNPGDCDGLNLLSCPKKEAYACDIVYGTNNEFGFDYLRDNMAMSMDDVVQKELYFCIVDEADSILIDEARTPLIISAPAEESNDLYVRFARVVPKLNKETDYAVDEKAHSVTLTDEGAEKMEKLLGVANIWQDYKLAHHLENALKAMELYKKDTHYIVVNGEVLIVDDFTGRVLEGRRYSEGLHQAIEAKEGVPIKRESKTLGTITFQNFFRLYKILSGGSGTVMTESEEFYKIYNLESIEVPTNQDVIRIDNLDRVYKNRDVKFNAVVEEVIELHKKGQPVLVGTSSIDDSEFVSKKLENKGITHEVLNAKQHEKEAHIVANAGKKSAVTVATNMAGRGTDIKLGGKNADDKEFEEVVELGGLAIIGTQRHESRRIDNQLRGRSGRQGEPGMSRFYVALDDDIMRIQGGEMVQRVMEMANLPEDVPIEAGMIGRSIETAQKRMEGMHFDSRKTVVEYDDVVNQQREIFYSRRRRILEEIEQTEKLLADKEVNKVDAVKSIANTFWENLENEIEFVVKLHFIGDRSDQIDKVKVIDDFLDLAHDKFFAETSPSILNSSEDIKEQLIKQTENLNSEQIKDLFIELGKNAFDKKIEEFGTDITAVSKMIILRTMDELWTDHLDAMKALRDGIGLRGFAQHDPLVEYKNEGFEIFDKFINDIDKQVARRILKVRKVVGPLMVEDRPMNTNESEIEEKATPKISRINKAVGNIGQAIKTEAQKTVQVDNTIGRNDKVNVQYTNGEILEGVKYKKVEQDIKSGKCRVIIKTK